MNKQLGTLAIVLVLASCLSGIFADPIPASKDKLEIESWESYWQYRERLPTHRFGGATVKTLQAMLEFLERVASYSNLGNHEADRKALAGLLEILDVKKENCGEDGMGKVYIAKKIQDFKDKAPFILNRASMNAFHLRCQGVYLEKCQLV